MLNLKTKLGSEKPSFVSLDQRELVSRVHAVVSGLESSTRALDKSHTKMAQAYGGGARYHHVFRSREGRTVNGDLVFPQISIFDRTFAGKSLRAFVGFYRVVCSNGLVVPAGENLKLVISHRLSNEEQLAEVDKTIAAAWGYVQEAQAFLERAAGVSVNPKDVIDRLPMFSDQQKETFTKNLRVRSKARQHLHCLRSVQLLERNGSQTSKEQVVRILGKGYHVAAGDSRAFSCLKKLTTRSPQPRVPERGPQSRVPERDPR